MSLKICHCFQCSCADCKKMSHFVSFLFVLASTALCYQKDLPQAVDWQDWGHWWCPAMSLLWLCFGGQCWQQLVSAQDWWFEHKLAVDLQEGLSHLPPVSQILTQLTFGVWSSNRNDSFKIRLNQRGMAECFVYMNFDFICSWSHDT